MIGTLVAVKPLKLEASTLGFGRSLSRTAKQQLQRLKEIVHENLNKFVGVAFGYEGATAFVVTQFCTRGSLKDVLLNEDLYLDEMFIASLVFDLIKVEFCY